MTLSVAILGCGMMGRVHADGWMARSDARVTAVYDPLEERCRQLAAHTGATPYADADDAIAKADIVSICTPICFHAEQAIAAATRGKHILCEKAIALTLDDAEAMIAAARANQVWLSVSFQYRGFGRFRRCHDLFASGAFGGPLLAQFTDVREVRPKLAMHRQSMNNGPVIDMVGHYTDLLRFITGEEPVRVFAGGHVFGRSKQRLAGIDDLAIDAAVLDVTMSGGSAFSVLINWGMPEGFPSVGGELLAGPALTMQTAGGHTIFNFPTHTETTDFSRMEPAGSSVRINDMAEAVFESRSPEVTGEDGRAALAVSLAALRSIEIGEAVTC